MSNSNRTITRLVLFALVLTLSLGVSWAGLTEGSTATLRANTDTAFAQVFIYDGGAFNNLEQVTTFTYFQSAFTGTRFMTPILFQETGTGQFTVVGIGNGQTLTSGAGAPSSFTFQPVLNGTDTTGSSGLFFFGYINALVNTAGTETFSSAGTVTFNMTVDPGPGVDATSTNDWVFTQSINNISIGLGTVFFTPGHDPGTGTRFALNNSTNGAFNTDRTYSANLTGISASVPEPGTITLFTSGAGLLLAGLLRFRRKS